MSTKITEIVEVIQEVSKQLSVAPNKSIRSLRIDADKHVAKNRGLYNTSVSDSYRTRLKPDIKCTEDFDRLLGKWLLEGSDELEEVLRRHSSGSDIKVIDSVFNDLPETEEYLASEFGYGPRNPEFKEGKDKLSWHLRKERSKSLVNRAKETWGLDFAGKVRCRVCDFSFLECYGTIGEGYIEAHHILPVSELTEETEVKVENLAPVCSNCHSMIHRQRPWRTIEELRNIIVKNHT